MKKDWEIMRSYWFLVGLSLLILNDFVFKAYYHNWLTGKLSDVVGLFVFSLFCWAILPKKHQSKTFLGLALLFIFWKSSYSQFCIDCWNQLMSFSIDRVVDYTDLIALLGLPWAAWLVQEKRQLSYVKLSPILPAVVAIFAFCATSYSNAWHFNKNYTFPFSKVALLNKINTIRMDQGQCPISMDIESANDFIVYGGNDTLWRSVRKDGALVQVDSLYLNDKGEFYWGIPVYLKDSITCEVQVKIVLGGDDVSSYLSLIKGTTTHSCVFEEKVDKQSYLLEKLEKILIQKK